MAGAVKPRAARGQPSKYKPEYCEAVIEHMRNGNSLISFAAAIGVSKECVYHWSRSGKYPDFSAALNTATTLSEAYWEKVLKEKTVTKTQGSDALLVFWMKNRFGWADRQHSEIKQETKTVVEFSSEIASDGSVTRTATESDEE